MSGKKQKAIRRLARGVGAGKPQIARGVAALNYGLKCESRHVLLKDCTRRDIKILKKSARDPSSEIHEALEDMKR
jgi:hypothetical protein